MRIILLSLICTLTACSGSQPRDAVDNYEVCQRLMVEAERDIEARLMQAKAKNVVRSDLRILDSKCVDGVGTFTLYADVDIETDEFGLNVRALNGKMLVRLTAKYVNGKLQIMWSNPQINEINVIRED